MRHSKCFDSLGCPNLCLCSESSLISHISAALEYNFFYLRSPAPPEERPLPLGSSEGGLSWGGQGCLLEGREEEQMGDKGGMNGGCGNGRNIIRLPNDRPKLVFLFISKRSRLFFTKIDL